MHLSPYREARLFPNLGYSEGFLRLWSCYPTIGRKRKSDAYMIFLKMGLENGHLEKVIQSVEIHKKTTKWHDRDGAFIPSLCSFLVYRRWEDEIDLEREIEWGEA